MTRQQLEHIIRAAAATSNTSEIVVIGSQSILGAFPDAPVELLNSMEADVFPRESPERSIVIDGAIGEESLFHQTFGYYGHGVDETTSILPADWQDRLVKISNANTMGATGWCLDPHDLAISKLIAGRPKDLEFVDTMLANQMLDMRTLQQRLKTVDRAAPEVVAIANDRLNARMRS
jgi:hypothetical protein